MNVKTPTLFLCFVLFFVLLQQYGDEKRYTDYYYPTKTLSYTQHKMAYAIKHVQRRYVIFLLTSFQDINNIILNNQILRKCAIYVIEQKQY